jgi:hypothetical protein
MPVHEGSAIVAVRFCAVTIAALEVLLPKTIPALKI